MQRRAAAGAAVWGLLLLLAGLCMALLVVPNLDAGSAARAASARPTDPPSVGQALEGKGASSQEAPRLQLVASGEQGIILEFTPPAFQVVEGASEDGPCHIIGVAGLGETDRAGWPRLPVRGAMVGIPPDVEPTLTLLEADPVTLSGRYDLCPVPRPILKVEGTGQIAYHGQEAIRDTGAYAAAGLYPPSPAEIVSTGLLRSQRVAQIRFHPFQYDPVSGELQVHRRIRVRLEFDAKGAALSATGLDVEEGSFEQILDHLLVNYDTARRWRVAPGPRTGEPTIADPQPGGYKVLVDEDGIYQVTHSDLASAGVELGGTDPHTLRLYNGGREVAIHVAGEEDGSFDEGDSILFYGQTMDTKYTDVNVYWLSWGGDAGRRMPEQDGTPGGTAPVPPYFQTVQRVEKDLNYQAPYPSGPDQDHWYWNWLWATSPTVAHYSTTLQHIATSPLTATLSGLFQGYYATPQHHTRVYLNGHLIDDAKWLPMAEYTFTVPVSQSLLIEGANTISVECPLDEGITEDYVIVNRFEIDYYDTYVAEDDLLSFDVDEPGTWEFQVSGFTTSTLEAFDITTPSTPTRILSFTVEPAGSAFALRFEDTSGAGDHYFAQASGRRLSPLSIEEDLPSDLRSATHGADYVIITHADFYSDLLPLAAHRAGQGLRTLVVDVQDVYDEFSYGIFDPEAIHDFLAYAYANWQPPAPAYVLLVGDGNYDFRNNYGRNEPNYVPPYLADVDPWISEVAADNRYVCVSGDDILPDMHLGRLPVKTSAEASAVVAKILAYEQDPPGGDWNQQVLFVADNADAAGAFDVLSDNVADHYLPSPYTAQKVYYKVTHSTAAGAKAAILSAINEGRLLVNYIGHATIQFWAFEHLLDLVDIAALTNTRRLPLVVPMTCLDGYYIHPSRPDLDLSCVGESFVRAPGGGAIASWSPTGKGVATGHDFLNKGLFEAIFFDDVVRVGPATTQAKLYLYSSTGWHMELLDSYILFGDPALSINALPADVQVEKTVEPPGDVGIGDPITYTLSFTNAGPAWAHRVILTDIIPPQLANPVVVYSSSAVISQYPGVTFAWTISDLLPHTGGEIQIRAVVATAPGLVVNEAVIDASHDITPANNTDVVTTSILLPDLVLDKIGPGQVGVGEIITYTVTWGNQGAIAADGVRITDTLPSWVEYVGDTSGFALTEPSAGVLVWQVTPDPLPATAEGSFVLTGSVMVDLGMSGPLLNRAKIGSDAPDYDPSNDEGQWPTDLLLPDVGVRKTGPRWAFAESTITYTIEYSNGGGVLAPGVVLTDVLPAGLTYLRDDSDLDHSEPLSGTHVWQVGQLPVGDGDTFHLVVVVGSRHEIPTALTNRVWIRTASPDENPANDESQHEMGVSDYRIYLPLVFRQGPGY